MGRYLARRLAQAVFVLWAAFTVAFALLYLLPSDPVAIMLDSGGEGTFVDPEQRAELTARYGLDEPVHVQYLTMLADAARGDFGVSISTGAPVRSMIVEALPETLELAGTALVLALVLGAGTALAATYTRRPWLRQLLLALPPLGVSVPTFWTGLLLLQLVSFRWGLLPAMGDDGVRALVLPAITLALPTAAVIAQVLAKSLALTWSEPYIGTARAKGVSRSGILLGHAARNAAIPVLTLVGVTVGNLVAGSVIVETVFSRAGIGRLTQAAVGAQDIPVVQGLVVLAAVIFVVVNLAVDLVYPLVDPRITRARTLAVAS
ncbi:ABC transporter permease [Jiangella endophytica]|uniref:ABC transporter permease n=1 Tax=Jiangella endophytica TaxID=1623398 RepID=UPI000E347805|nr:ABC transporter permease [Jiangella endophytica]